MKIKKKNVFLLGILLYIAYNGLTYMIGITTKSYNVKLEEMELKVSTTGIIIRDEYLIKSNYKGSLQNHVNDHEKINKDQDIASVYSDNNYHDVENEITKLQEEIAEIEEGKGYEDNENVLVLNQTINTVSKDIIKSTQDLNIKEVNNKYESLKSSTDDKDEVVKNDINNTILNTKKSQLDALINTKENNVGNVKSEYPGIISFNYDENESEINYDIIDNIDSNYINNMDNEYKEVVKDGEKIKEDEVIARVIKENTMYIAIEIEDGKNELLSVDDNVEIRLKDQVVNSKVHKKYKDIENNNIVIFEINEQNELFLDTRVEEFDIIYKQLDGIKLQKKSIKEKDGKNGVYVINSETKYPEFVEITGIVHEDKENVIIDCNSEDYKENSSIELHDEILMNPNIINTKIKIE